MEFVAGMVMGSVAVLCGVGLHSYLEGRKDPEIDTLKHSLADSRGDVANAATALGLVMSVVVDRTAAHEIPPAIAREVAIKFGSRYPGHSAAVALTEAAEAAERELGNVLKEG